jgi:hypothetical protein
VTPVSFSSFRSVADGGAGFHIRKIGVGWGVHRQADYPG